MLNNCLKCFFVVFENHKNWQGKKTEIGKIWVGILLYTKNFFKKVQKLDWAGKGNTIFFLPYGPRKFAFNIKQLGVNTQIILVGIYNTLIANRKLKHKN